jgi:hypothetical protein
MKDHPLSFARWAAASSFRAFFVLALILGALAWIGPNAPVRAGDGYRQTAVSINEIRIDQTGADNDEYFELYGTGGASLNGLTYLVIGDGTVGSGVIEAVVNLTGQTIPGDGFFVAAEATFSLAVADMTTSLNFENSDNVTHLLVQGFSGSDGQDLDTDDDGTLDITPWTSIVDSVALLATTSGGDLVYSSTTVGPDGSFVPGQVHRCPDGTGSWNIGDFGPSPMTRPARRTTAAQAERLARAVTIPKR